MNVCIHRNLTVVWKWNISCVIGVEVWDIKIHCYISGSCTYAQLSCLVVMNFWFNLRCADKISLVQGYFSKFLWCLFIKDFEKSDWYQVRERMERYWGILILRHPIVLLYSLENKTHQLDTTTSVLTWIKCFVWISWWSFLWIWNM